MFNYLIGLNFKIYYYLQSLCLKLRLSLMKFEELINTCVCDKIFFILKADTLFF